MKKLDIILPFIYCIILTAGCAKVADEGANEGNQRFFDAWMTVNYPDIYRNGEGKEGLGIYVLEREPGNGEEVKEGGYALVDFTISDLNGEITSYTGRETAEQLGTDHDSYYYGPKVWTTTEKTIQAGVAEGLIGMNVGERKKFIVPSWLMSYSAYDSEKDYLKKATDYSHTIYDVTVRDYTSDISEYQIENIKAYISRNYDSLNEFSNDTTGFYWHSLGIKHTEGAEEPEQDDNGSWFPSDTTVYINYTGRLLNGLVFDTTIENIAKDNHLYNESRTYEPLPVSWADSRSELRLDGNSVVAGFTWILWKMKPMEKAVGIFYSPLGYGYSSSGNSIPSYSPLVFEIEMVEEPED